MVAQWDSMGVWLGFHGRSIWGFGDSYWGLNGVYFLEMTNMFQTGNKHLVFDKSSICVGDGFHRYVRFLEAQDKVIGCSWHKSVIKMKYGLACNQVLGGL